MVDDEINFFKEIKEEIRATKREADSKTISKLDSIFIEDIKEVEDDQVLYCGGGRTAGDLYQSRGGKAHDADRRGGHRRRGHQAGRHQPQRFL